MRNITHSNPLNCKSTVKPGHPCSFGVSPFLLSTIYGSKHICQAFTEMYRTTGFSICHPHHFTLRSIIRMFHSRPIYLPPSLSIANLPEQSHLYRMDTPDLFPAIPSKWWQLWISHFDDFREAAQDLLRNEHRKVLRLLYKLPKGITGIHAVKYLYSICSFNINYSVF